MYSDKIAHWRIINYCHERERETYLFKNIFLVLNIVENPNIFRADRNLFFLSQTTKVLNHLAQVSTA
jgi:hypothetical protein